MIYAQTGRTDTEARRHGGTKGEEKQFTRQQLEVIEAALQQLVTAFEQARKGCIGADGKPCPPDALVANYAIVARLFDEQISQAAAVLNRATELMEKV